jgi:PAS domain S-box-containing protein
MSDLQRFDVNHLSDGDGSSAVLTILRSVEDLQRTAPDSSSPSALVSRHRQMLEAIGVGVYVTDAAGRITYFNAAATELWGRTPEFGEEWCGSWRLFSLDGRPIAHAACPMAIALTEGRPVRGEVAVVERPDGSRVVLMPYPTPLRDADDRIVGAVNVLVDVTERHSAEAALRGAVEALAASNAVKDEFLGLVSHELRTPVTTIFGNAQLLRARADTLEPERRDAMLDDIADDAARLRDVIENLLLLTRLGSDEPIDVEPVLLSRTLESAVGAFRRRHPNRSIRLAALPREAIVEAQASSIGQVIENLLSNADKYSDSSQSIDVRLEADVDEVRVLVLDRGIGIDPAQTEELFNPFYRTPEAKKRAGGVGIGLAVCRRIVETEGGRIWARPRPGGGTEFGFALPRVIA